MPSRLRLNKGTEIVDLAIMHSYLVSKYSHDDNGTNCVKYGPSTENKIERWWKELLERLEMFFKEQVEDEMMTITEKILFTGALYTYI